MLVVFFFNHTADSDIYTLSLHDALPIWLVAPSIDWLAEGINTPTAFCSAAFTSGCVTTLWKLGEPISRSEEHTSELQSRRDLVCRLLLEKKKDINLYNSRNYSNLLLINK